MVTVPLQFPDPRVISHCKSCQSRFHSIFYLLSASIFSGGAQLCSVVEPSFAYRCVAVPLPWIRKVTRSHGWRSTTQSASVRSSMRLATSRNSIDSSVCCRYALLESQQAMFGLRSEVPSYVFTFLAHFVQLQLPFVVRNTDQFQGHRPLQWWTTRSHLRLHRSIMLLFYDCGLYRGNGFCHTILVRCISLGEHHSRRKIWQSHWFLRWLVSLPYLVNASWKTSAYFAEQVELPRLAFRHRIHNFNPLQPNHFHVRSLP